jgi:hypothetical protein
MPMKPLKVGNDMRCCRLGLKTSRGGGGGGGKSGKSGKSGKRREGKMKEGCVAEPKYNANEMRNRTMTPNKKRLVWGGSKGCLFEFRTAN